MGKAVAVSTIEYIALSAISRILGTFVINSPVDPKTLAKDQAVGVEYSKDPNVHPYVALRTVR